MSEHTTPEQRAELLALAERATPRPWIIAGHPDEAKRLIINDQDGKFLKNVAWHCYGHDAAYIAASCNLAPELAREVEERTAERDNLGAFIQELYQRLPVGAQYIMLTFGKEKGVLK